MAPADLADADESAVRVAWRGVRARPAARRCVGNRPTGRGGGRGRLRAVGVGGAGAGGLGTGLATPGRRVQGGGVDDARDADVKVAR
jgi:hypothetical protein